MNYSEITVLVLTLFLVLHFLSYNHATIKVINKEYSSFVNSLIYIGKSKQNAINLKEQEIQHELKKENQTLVYFIIGTVFAEFVVFFTMSDKSFFVVSAFMLLVIFSQKSVKANLIRILIRLDAQKELLN